MHRSYTAREPEPLNGTSTGLGRRAGKLQANRHLSVDRHLAGQEPGSPERFIQPGFDVQHVVRGVGEPVMTVYARGVPCYDEVVAEAARSARRALAGPSQVDRTGERIRRAVRQALGDMLGDRPTVDVSVVDIGPEPALRRPERDGKQQG